MCLIFPKLSIVFNSELGDIDLFIKYQIVMAFTFQLPFLVVKKK